MNNEELTIKKLANRCVGVRPCQERGEIPKGTPSPEVTGLICRVPERAFSRAPLDILLVYLCRFVVRFPTFLLRGFSRQRGISSFRPYGLLLCASVLMSLRICLEKPPYAHRTGHNRPAYPSASPHRDNEKLGVPEY